MTERAIVPGKVDNMRKYRTPAVEDLAMQLQRGPTRLCLKQLLQIEFLLSIVETEKSYPFDFVRHALTGFRPVGPSENDGSELIDGAALREDLVYMAEQLSDNAALPVEACSEPLHSVSDLAARFDVSTKTVFRWRQRGLAGWRFRFPDRRSRIAFPERCVRRFVAENSDLVARGSSFSLLNTGERNDIVEQAKSLSADCRRTVNAVARVIATRTGRAVETIRLILKNYDGAHPKAGIFNRPALDVEPDDCRLVVWEAYVDGASIKSLSRRFSRSLAWVYRTITTMRAKEIKARKIDFIYSGEFDAPGADRTILDDARLEAAPAGASPRIPADLAPYLQQLFRIPLLSREREAALFRQYNYLKFKADRSRHELDPETAKPVELDRIERILSDAVAVRSQITQANLRLVVSIAKRHAGKTCDFFEIISDGNMSLMKAVEKFDYSRGFKFSTYASWAIMKNYARTVPEQTYHYDRYQTGRDELLESVPGPTVEEHAEDLVPAMRTSLERMLGTLSDREQRILRRHYGLDSHGQVMTLAEIGREFGVSKERVRQIESRAICKLRDEFDHEFDALLVG